MALFWPAYFGAEPWTASKTAASGPMFAPGATPSPPTRPAREVAHDVAVEVRQHQHVVQLGLLDELHAHVVDDAVLELDPAGVVRRDRPAALEEQPVGELHDVRLVHGRDLAPAVGDRVLEREAGDPLRGLAGDDLDALRGIAADDVLDARVEVLGVLADDDEVDVVEAADDALHRAGRAQVRVQAERLAERHVDAAEALPHRRRDRALDGDLVAPDRLEDVLPGAACRGPRSSASPASTTSHSNSMPVASRTRRVASASSGPMPSPGIRVTRWAMRQF